MAWKADLIAQATARSTGAATRLGPADLAGLTEARDAYRRVTLSGRFLHDREVYLHAVVGDTRKPVPGRLQGQGWFVVTPLEMASGQVVLVNRGFVPTELRDPGVRLAGQGTDPVTVTGLVRFDEPRSWFSAPDDATRRLFFTRDIDAMARAVDVRPVASVVIDAEAGVQAGLIPEGGHTRLSFPNRHFEYALTWFGLAITLIGVFAAFVRARLRRDHRP